MKTSTRRKVSSSALVAAAAFAAHTASFAAGGVSAPNITWDNLNGTGSGLTWDTTSQNWNTGTAPAVYANGDIVTFNDTNNGHYSVTVSGTLTPAAVTVNNTTGNYLFSGSGVIAGSATLSKLGADTLTITNTNTFGGGTDLYNGVLKISSDAALGASTGGLTFYGGKLETYLNAGSSSRSYTLQSNAAIQIDTGPWTITGNISGPGSLSTSGGGELALDGTNSYGGGTTIASTLLIQSSLPAGGSVTNSGLLLLDGGNSTIGSITGSGATYIYPASGLKLGTNSGASSESSLYIFSGGTLDLNNDHMFINYGSLADPISSIAALISSGYAGGTWAGTGITSSAAAANAGSYGIGYADGADPGNPAGLTAGQIEIKYTLLGDANLDGKVNGTDFTLMSTHFNQAVTNGWDEGDFNYSNTVNGSDFVKLANNFNQFASQADIEVLDSFAAANGISLTSVPEPASMLTMVIAGSAIFYRGRRSVQSVKVRRNAAAS